MKPVPVDLDELAREPREKINWELEDYLDESYKKDKRACLLYVLCMLVLVILTSVAAIYIMKTGFPVNLIP